MSADDEAFLQGVLRRMRNAEENPNPLIPPSTMRRGRWSPSGFHLHLFNAILWPVVQENRSDDATWPVWRFVVRSLNEKGYSAEELFMALPAPIDNGTREGYGFIWRANSGASTLPQPGEKVGLTLAGLRLAGPMNPADTVAQLAASFAADEEALPNDPNEFAQQRVPFNDRAARTLSRRSYQRAGITSMTVQAAAELLMHEHPSLVSQSNHPGKYEVHIGPGNFAWLAGVNDARGYLDAVWTRYRSMNATRTDIWTGKTPDLPPENESDGEAMALNMMPDQQVTVTIVHQDSTGNEGRAESRAIIHASKGYFDVATQIFDGDIVEVADPRGFTDRRVVTNLKMNNYGSEDMQHIAVQWGTATTVGAGTEPPRTIFLVHGHDGEAKHHIARFLEQATAAAGTKVTILDEQPNRGDTIIEKFERHAKDSGYAVVLLTPDDEGGVAGRGEVQKRARQNVVYEMGYFIGKLGRDKVAVINAGVEPPSDVAGVAYIPYPNGNWKADLISELKAGGLPAALP